MSSDLEAAFEQLLPIFRSESAEALGRMEQSLLLLEKEPNDEEALAEIFRVLHTLKGDAATLGFQPLRQLSHALEDILSALRAGEAVVTRDIITGLLRATDVLRQRLAECIAPNDSSLEAGDEDLIQQLEALLNSEDEESTATGPTAADLTPRAGASDLAGERRNTLRVDVGRLDQLLTLVGEMAVARGALTQLLEDPVSTRDSILENHREADRLHLDLQDLVTRLRMVPVGPTFGQFHRLVRDLALELGKEAVLKIEGADVELDNTMLQMLRDPLNHMVRNALSHGIELPTQRRRVKKPQCGTITLRSFQQAGSITIEVEDDGAGIDPERVLAHARSQGLAEAERDLQGDEILSLVFVPGFSTADEVSEVAGRGVGLDVVRRNIETLRGSVEVTSEIGRGTTIAIRVPLTLAIIDGLHVRVADEIYVIPLEAVVELLELPEPVGRSNRGVMELRSQTLPYVRLRQLFDIDGHGEGRESMVVVRAGNDTVALIVDGVDAKRQTVIKPLGRILRQTPGLLGSSVLGNGQIAFILDVSSLLQRELAATSSN